MCKMVSVTSITIVEVALVIMGDFNNAGGRRYESEGVNWC